MRERNLSPKFQIVRISRSRTHFFRHRFVPQIAAVYAPTLQVTPTTTLGDVFAPVLDPEFYQKLFNITRAFVGADYTKLGPWSTFERSSIDTFSTGACVSVSVSVLCARAWELGSLDTLQFHSELDLVLTALQ